MNSAGKTFVGPQVDTALRVLSACGKTVIGATERPAGRFCYATPTLVVRL